MTRELHPSEGARFLLERVSESESHDRAVYRAAIFTPDQCFEYAADLAVDGSCQVAAHGSPAGDELENKLVRIARLVARSAHKRQDDQLPPWPHRILRWRGPGRG